MAVAHPAGQTGIGGPGVMRLALYHGDTPDRYVELREADIRIGRAQDNDVVLEDPQKGVSRYHAEIRFEHGRFVIVDLNSQNGVWIEERRITREALPQGVAVSIGPYRLFLEPSAGEEAAAPVEPEPDSETRLVGDASPFSVPAPEPAIPEQPAQPPAEQRQRPRQPIDWRRPPPAIAGGALALVVIIGVVAAVVIA